MKRHGATGHSNDCIAMPQGGDSALNFAGAATDVVLEAGQHSPEYLSDMLSMITKEPEPDIIRGRHLSKTRSPK